VTAPEIARARTSPRRLALVLVLALLGAMVVAASIGAVAISPRSVIALLFEPLGLVGSGVTDAERAIFWSVRVPRVVLGALVGIALGGAGAAVQGLFRNPLADPGLVGVSAGAALGAALTIVVGGGLLAALPSWVRPAVLPLAAFAGGAVVTVLVLRLGAPRGRAAAVTVLLAGVAINALVGAFVGLLSHVASDAELRDLTFWTLGGLGGATWTRVAFTAPWILGTAVLLPRLGRSLDLLSLGEREARYLGVRVERLRTAVVLAIAIGVGAAFSAAGLIGFVGLVVPHLVRLLVGPRHAALIPLSSLFGGALLVGADAVARTVIAPSELPVGLLTASLGAPFFLLLLRREARVP
jgi:iron complex transport system permease protein